MRKLLLIIGLVLLLSLGFAGPAFAQEEWECIYDFTLSNGGFASFGDFDSGNGGIYNPGTGWEDNFGTDVGNAYRMVQIVRVFPETTVESVVITFDITNGLQETGTPGAIDSDDTNLESTSTPFADGDGQTFDWTGSETTTQISFRVQSGFDAGSSSDPGGSVLVTELEMSGEGANPCEIYVKPLMSADEDVLTANLNVLSTPADNAVFAFSGVPGANVFAAAAGTITEMRLLDPDTDCDDNFNRADSPFNSHPCQLLTPYDSIAYFPDGGREATTGADVWIVKLFTDEGFEFTYFVESADMFLSEGQAVEAGCILGKTFRLEPGNNPPDFDIETHGLAIVNLREGSTIIPLIDNLNIEPVESAACNIDPDNANCMGDVQLNDPSQWESSTGVAFNEPGFTLLGGLDAHLRTSMNLDPDQKPELQVTLRASGGGNGNFELTLGQTTTEFSLSEAAGFQTYGIEGDTHQPDGEFYTVRILNDGTSTLDVIAICVRFTDDGEGNPIDNPDPPAACIFANNSFNDGTTGWTVSSTEPGPGEIRVATGGTFEQSVTVPAGDYTLTLVTALWHYNSYVPDDQDTDDVDIEFSFDTSPAILDTHTYGEFAENNNIVIYSTTVNIPTDTTDVFSFEVTLNSPATGVRGLVVRSVCLDDGSGGGDGGGGDGDGIFEPTCGTISTPTGDDFGVWISWHWAQLNKFYRCELMILLNNLYRFLQRSWITVTWSTRWSQAATVKSINWFGAQFVPWLGGHLHNVAVGQVTNITTAEQCGNVFCLLQSLVTGFSDIVTTLLNGIRDIMEDVIGGLVGLLGTALNAIISFLQQILGFIFSVLGLVIGIAVDIVELLILLIGKAVELFEIVREILDMLLNSWLNADPIEWEFLPSCATDATHARCMFFYISERTIFTESGPAIFNTLIAGLWMNLFFFVIYAVKNALVTLGLLT